MPVLGYKVAGAAPNFGEMAWGTVRDIRAAVVGTASEDGWVTHLGIRAGRNTASNASDKLGLYKATAGTIGARVAETAAFTISSPMVDQSGGTLYERAVPAGTKIEAGQQYAVANAVLSNSIGYAQGPTAYPMHFRNGTGTLPDPFAADAVETETQMGVYVVYTANRAPGAPTIIGPPSGAVTADPTPELRVGFVDADTGLGDAMTAWQFQVCDEAGTAVLHDSAKTSGTGGEAAWIPPALTPSTVYTIKAWTWDGHDTKSAVRSWKITVAGGGTLTFTGLSPDEGSFAGNAIYNTGSPRYATYHWAHDTGESTAWWYQRIVNPATGAVVRAEIGSALVDPDDTDRNVSWKSGWAPLPAGLTPYVWEVRVEDALGGETEWVRSDPFIINAGPNTPTGLSPAGGIITDYPVLASVHEDATDAASLLDVRHEVRPVGGVAVAVAASHAGGGTFTSATDATAFPAWGEYEWRAIVTDPWGLSAASSWHSLSYLAPPAITPVHPLAGETLTEPAPTVTWTLNRTQARYRVTVRERGGARVHYISWIVQSDAGRHTLPVPLPNATDYDLVLWAETADGATDEVIVPFRLDYASAAARSAEQQSLIATEGEARTADEYDEIVLDGVSIPIRSIQRTDTSRFEGKVTFGDYTVDSDQLMSTWAQSSWVGGMNVATQIEGATDSRFRWARAWTQSASQLTLPLATSRVDIAWSAPPAPTVATETGGNFGEGVGEAYQPWLTHARTARPLGARGGVVYAACGKALSAVNLVTRTPYLIGDLAAAPVNAGAWYGTGDADTLRLYLPLGEFGLQAYNPGTNEIEAANTAIAAVAVLAFDTRLYAVTTANDVLWLTPDGLWTEADPALHIPPDEAARHLVSYFDRSGNAAVVVVTNRQAWVVQDEAASVVPLGLAYPLSDAAGEAAAVWRDDGLYVADTLAITRLSTAGVITPVGLDRDDGFQLVADFGDEAGLDAIDTHRIAALAPSTNLLLAAVRGYVTSANGVTSSRNVLLGWNEAGWHYVAALDRDATGGAAFEPCGLLIADGRSAYVAVTGSCPADAADASAQSGSISLTDLPEGLHAPRARLTRQPVSFAPEGVLLTGWIDASMRNFFKAWSHVEVTLARVSPHDAAPPGAVDVAYRTEDDPATWHLLGTADQFGRNVFPINTINGVDRGLMSSRIELMLTLRDTTGATPLAETPIVESLVLKFIKLAQHGSAWQAYVALSDYDTHRNVGPTQLDDFLSRLSAEGSAYGPYSSMIHLAKTEEGWEEKGRYRVRVAQWQRSEGTGKVPYGDGVLNIIQVPIPRGDPA